MDKNLLIRTLQHMADQANWDCDDCTVKRPERSGEKHDIFIYSWGVKPWIAASEALKNFYAHDAQDMVPCRHEFYQGVCAHCELPASEYRNTRALLRDLGEL